MDSRLRGNDENLRENDVEVVGPVYSPINKEKQSDKNCSDRCSWSNG